MVLLLLNGYFVAAEFALVRSRRTRLESMARGGDAMARAGPQGDRAISPRMLSASQLGITLASLGLGALAEETLRDYFAHLVARLPFADRAVGARGARLGVRARARDVLPRGVRRAGARGRWRCTHPERVARWLVPPLFVFEWLMRPFAVTLNRSSELVLRAFGQKPQPLEESLHSPDELRILVEQSQEGGVLERTDATLLEGVFEFSEKNAREVMTPRTDIDALPIDATLDETLALVEESGRSRYPVYEETIDNIVGLVLAKDLIPRAARAPPPATSRCASIMRPVHVVPGSREVEEVLADFKRLKEHMAIVLDEYGGTAGLVTMEDLLEEIVGEILDEYDEPPEHPEREGADLVIVPGSTNIGELNERFGLERPDDDYTTIGGFVFGALGRLPVVGDRVTAGGAVFTVREMDGRRIESLAVDLHSPGSTREASALA